jgi:adenylylsulfate kinase
MMNTGFTIWFTGLSGSGKSTLSEVIEQRMKALGRNVEVLDGDIVRTHLSKGLGFSREDRDTNIKRIGFVCNLLTRNGVICISAAIAPYHDAILLKCMSDAPLMSAASVTSRASTSSLMKERLRISPA